MQAVQQPPRALGKQKEACRRGDPLAGAVALFSGIRMMGWISYRQRCTRRAWVCRCWYLRGVVHGVGEVMLYYIVVYGIVSRHGTSAYPRRRQPAGKQPMADEVRRTPSMPFAPSLASIAGRPAERRTNVDGSAGNAEERRRRAKDASTRQRQRQCGGLSICRRMAADDEAEGAWAAAASSKGGRQPRWSHPHRSSPHRTAPHPMDALRLNQSTSALPSPPSSPSSSPPSRPQIGAEHSTTVACTAAVRRRVVIAAVQQDQPCSTGDPHRGRPIPSARCTN